MCKNDSGNKSSENGMEKSNKKTLLMEMTANRVGGLRTKETEAH